MIEGGRVVVRVPGVMRTTLCRVIVGKTHVLVCWQSTPCATRPQPAAPHQVNRDADDV